MSFSVSSRAPGQRWTTPHMLLLLVLDRQARGPLTWPWRGTPTSSSVSITMATHTSRMSCSSGVSSVWRDSRDAVDTPSCTEPRLTPPLCSSRTVSMKHLAAKNERFWLANQAPSRASRAAGLRSWAPCSQWGPLFVTGAISLAIPRQIG